MMEVESALMTSLDEMIDDENKIVTYKSVCQNLALSVAESRKLLEEYLQAKKTPLNLTCVYLLSGITSRGRSLVLARDTELETAKSRFKHLVGCHVYSVHKSKLVNADPLYSVDYDMIKKGANNCANYGRVKFKDGSKMSDQELAEYRASLVPKTENQAPQSTFGFGKSSSKSSPVAKSQNTKPLNALFSQKGSQKMSEDKPKSESPAPPSTFGKTLNKTSPAAKSQSTKPMNTVFSQKSSKKQPGEKESDQEEQKPGPLTEVKEEQICDSSTSNKPEKSDSSGSPTVDKSQNMVTDESKAPPSTKPSAKNEKKKAPKSSGMMMFMKQGKQDLFSQSQKSQQKTAKHSKDVDKQTKSTDDDKKSGISDDDDDDIEKSIEVKVKKTNSTKHKGSQKKKEKHANTVDEETKKTEQTKKSEISDDDDDIEKSIEVKVKKTNSIKHKESKKKEKHVNTVDEESKKKGQKRSEISDDDDDDIEKSIEVKVQKTDLTNHNKKSQEKDKIKPKKETLKSKTKTSNHKSKQETAEKEDIEEFESDDDFQMKKDDIVTDKEDKENISQKKSKTPSHPKHKEAGKKSNSKKPLKRRSKSSGNPEKKRKRIRMDISSSSEDESSCEEMVIPPSPPPPPVQSPPRRIKTVGGKNKKRVLKNRTYTDADGSMLTEKVWEEVSCSSADEEPVGKPPVQSPPKSAVTTPVAIAKLPIKKKQPSLMTFFGKKASTS